MNCRVLFFIMIFCFLNLKAYALSPLNEKEMKKHTGQSGISIAIENAVFYYEDSFIKFIDGDASDPGFISLSNTKSLHILDTGYNDLDSDGTADHLTIDIINPQQSNLEYDKPYLAMECNDWSGTSYFQAEEIIFSDHTLGSLQIDEAAFPKWHLYTGGHSSGIDLEAGFQMDIKSFSYNYGPSENDLSLKFEGIHFTQQFNLNTNDDPSNPETWQSSGKFKIGDFSTDTPVTIDVGTRENDNSPVLFISAPIKGAIRIENIHMGNTDFGPAAIDGINVHRMKIEIPGRGLGKS